MDILFSLKKLIGLSLMSVPIILLMLVVSTVLYHKTYKKLALTLGLGGLILLYILSTAPLANGLVSALESQYSAYRGQQVDYVLVLGGSHTSTPDRPLSSLLSSTSLNRLTEGLMIYRANPGAKLLLSGHEGADSESHARAASKLAIALGVPEQDILLAEEVKDTAEEAQHWVKLIAGHKFALVTSATHMLRAVYLFDQELALQGYDHRSLIPAPTNYTACVSDCFLWQAWIPKSRNLEKVDIAWHEYLGYIWARARAESN